MCSESVQSLAHLGLTNAENGKGPPKSTCPILTAPPGIAAWEGARNEKQGV
jgi:hypothetical protein